MYIPMVRKNSLKQASNSKRAAIPRRRRFKLGQAKLNKLLRGRIRQARYLLCLLGSLIVADGIISNFIVLSGLGTEGNPFIQSIVGQTSFVFLKLIAAFFGALILWKVFKQHRRLGLASIIFFVVLYTAILWWNLGIWFISQHNILVSAPA